MILVDILCLELRDHKLNGLRSPDSGFKVFFKMVAHDPLIQTFLVFFALCWAVLEAALFLGSVLLKFASFLQENTLDVNFSLSTPINIWLPRRHFRCQWFLRGDRVVGNSQLQVPIVLIGRQIARLICQNGTFAFLTNIFGCHVGRNHLSFTN